MTEQMKNALSWIIDRLSENSTWRGIILALTGIGITIEPQLAAKITAAGLMIVGAINIFRQGAPTKAQVKEALDSKVDKPDIP